MDDAQSPPDADNSKGEQTRRTGLRLRDAESVATTRRDMFGDGSLLDALAGGQSTKEEQQHDIAETPVAEPAEPLETAQADDASGAEAELQAQPQPEAVPDPGVADPQEPSMDGGQPLDTIIDSFPAEPASQAPEPGPADAQVDPSFLAASRFSRLDRAAEDSTTASDQSPSVPPERFQISAIFDGLGGAEPGAGKDNGPDEPDAAAPLRLPPRPEALHADMPADGISNVDQEMERDDGALTSAPPLSVAAEATTETEWAPLADAGAQSDWSQPDSVELPRPSDASEGPPLSESADDAAAEPQADAQQEAPQSEPAEGESDAGPLADPLMWPPVPEPPDTTAAAPAATEQPSLPDPTEWPPFPEPPGAAHAEAAPLLERPSMAGEAAGGSATPFPVPPAWPPFPEPPGAEPAQPPEPSGLPPYIELPAHAENAQAAPADTQDHSLWEFPPFSAAPAAEEAFSPPPGSSFHGPDAAEPGPPLPGAPALPPFPPEAETPPAAARPAVAEPREVPAASGEAKAKIAAEANATAQALDHLQRLLTQTTVPPATAAPQPAFPPPPRDAHLNGLATAPAFQRDDLASMLPLSMPPEHTSGRSVYLLGFLTGLVLSVMAGAALYFLIAAG